MSRMQAAYLEKPGKITVTEVPIPAIDFDEVLVKVERCGVCMTDVHMYRGSFPVKMPIILGHEFSGTVVDTGKNAGNYTNTDNPAPIKVGDGVTVVVNINCGACPSCLVGKINLCENPEILGAGEKAWDGAFAEYVRVPSRLLYKIPSGVSFATAAFTEPFACCLHAIDICRIKEGDSVVIIGAGAMGLLLLELVKLRSPSLIIVSEPLQERRSLAKKKGADVTIDPAQSDVVSQVREITTGKGVNVVIEVVGLSKTVEDAIQMTRKGGLVNIFGVPDTDAISNIKPFDVYFSELKIVGTFSFTLDTFRRTLQLFSLSHRLDIEYILTNELFLAELEKAFLMMERHEGLKKQIVFEQ